MNPYIRKHSSAGGLAVSRDKDHMRKIGKRGGLATSRDREHMRLIGRKGGATQKSITPRTECFRGHAYSKWRNKFGQCRMCMKLRRNKTIAPEAKVPEKDIK